MLLQDYNSVKKNNELVKEPFVRMWMNDSMVVTQNHLVQVFNSELHIIYSYSSKKEFKAKSILQDTTLLLLQDKLEQIDINSNATLKSTDSVFGVEIVAGNLVIVEKNGSIKSSNLNVKQSGTVLHTDTVNDQIAIVYQGESTLVQYFGETSSRFEIELGPKPKRFGVGRNCCFILCESN
jgi:frataxin-like iron-binding protein CyaY